MLKKDARRFFLEKRRSITLKEQQVWNDLLLIRFQQLALPPVHTVFAYAAIEAKKEISTDAIVGYLEFRNPGVRVMYPVFDPGSGSMKAVETNETTFFTVNNYGISEPEGGPVVDPLEIDLILVPLLCFDTRGFRVGYGKGVYDRYLKNRSPEAITIGLSYFDPITQIEDANEFDVSLDYCITPGKVYEF